VEDVLHPHRDAEKGQPTFGIGRIGLIRPIRPAGLERLLLPAQTLEATFLREEGPHYRLALREELL
jgi:hypothetical protein